LKTWPKPLFTFFPLDITLPGVTNFIILTAFCARVSEGQIVRGYNSPAPAPGTGPHRYVFLAMQQLGGKFSNIPTTMDEICKNDGRDNFNLVTQMTSRV
jgi:Phosphatidylethanolamine-binding protein